MGIFLIAVCLLLNVFTLGAQEIKPLYQLPEKINQSVEVNESENQNGTVNSYFLVGSDEGLFKVTGSNNVFPLWKEGRVDQILILNLPDAEGLERPVLLMRTEKGLFKTDDLENFEDINDGLPFLTIKKYENRQATLVKQIQELKDIAVNPLNNQEIVTATKDAVFLSRDAGKTWKNLKSMSLRTPGVKAVAVATIDGECTVFMSHPILGLSYIQPDLKNAAWKDVEDGFERMQSNANPDEISDILPVVRTNADGTVYTEIFLSQMFIPRIYKFNWQKKCGELIYKGTEPADAIDGLTLIDDVMLFTKLEGFGSYDINNFTSPGTPVKEGEWQKSFSAVPGMTNTAWIPQNRSGFAKGVLLNELWMLYPGTVNTTYAEKADGQKSIYASAYQCRNQAGIDKYKKIVKDRNMNSIVIDMKDDYGYLRYDSHDSEVLKKAKTSMYAVDLDHFISEFKKDNIYLIARIVTFKDRSLAGYSGGKYAVWDKANNKPWVGIKGYEDVLDDNGNATGEKTTTYYDENWVDPYSEEVWEYNILIAKELVARGFDEIQFDYIRFPTDGLNMYNAQYRWKNPGMDKESALISFLSYARENIKAPIGIDIYGANGWYRSGTRTGQDAEMLAEYVDVIGPMFYPSHFEDSWMNFSPVADRTYRIYFYGTFRNTILCRNRAIIRPWVQCFYLGYAPYDRKYYNSDYIKKEFFGVKDASNHGYMCWNNSGDYSVTPPDNTDTEESGLTTYEAGPEFRKPAVGTKMRPLYVEDNDLSILDSILLQYPEEDFIENKTSKPFLKVR